MLKEIYSFNVEIEKEVEEVTKETREVKGQKKEVEVKQTVTKKVPVEFVIKKPSRRERDEADFEFSVCMSTCVKKGILTKAMLAKKYADTGGALADKDAEELVDLYKKASNIDQEMVKITMKGLDKSSPEVSSKIETLQGEAAMIKRKIVDLETNYRTLFDNTADVKAQDKILLWYTTHLTYFKSQALEVPELTLFFKGDGFDERLDDFYTKDENHDEIFEKVIGKITTVVSYWYYSGGAIDREELDELVRDILEDEPEAETD